MKGFVINGNDVNIVKYDETNLATEIPKAIYSVKYNDMGGFFYLSKIDDTFKIDENVSELTEKRASKVIQKYLDSSKNTGVLLTGLKGAGKSYIMKYISNSLIDLQIPIITISEPFIGEQFNEFIYDIGSCVILIDEFAKVYKDRDKQNNLLSLFDGMYESSKDNKKLFILSENNEHTVGEYFIKRPGRLHYHFEYDRLEEDAINGYLNRFLDKRFSDGFKKEIIYETNFIIDLSFDILKAIVQEINMFCTKETNEELEELYTDLNIGYTKNRKNLTYKVKVLNVNDVNIKLSDTSLDIDTNDIARGFWVNYNEDDEVHINPNDLKIKDKNIILFVGTDYKLVIEEVVETTNEYDIKKLLAL